MNKIKELETQLIILEKQATELKDAATKYYSLCATISKIKKTLSDFKKEQGYNKITIQTEYREPNYPRMGQSGDSGFAYLKNEEQAKELQKALIGHRGYSYGYELKYKGPGKYRVVPDYKYDHDGDLIYTATFIKIEED